MSLCVDDDELVERVAELMYWASPMGVVLPWEEFRLRWDAVVLLGQARDLIDLVRG